MHFDAPRLVSLKGIEGLSSCLKNLSLDDCSSLSSLVGLEELLVLQNLSVAGCGITSLQPVADMNVGLTGLSVKDCRNVREDVLELPEIHFRARGVIARSNVKKVLVAGGVQVGLSTLA